MGSTTVNAHLDGWKSDLSFTGDLLVFPAEMFILLMEKKFGILILENNFVVNAALQHIPDSLDENKTSAGLWKNENNLSKRNIDWNGFKIEMLKKFGQKKNYDTFERLQFLKSAKRGQNETYSMFLARLSIIVSFIEFGQICDKTPSIVWVKLLMLLGLEPNEKFFTMDELEKMSLDQLSLAVSNKKSEFEGINQNISDDYIKTTSNNNEDNVQTMFTIDDSTGIQFDFLYDDQAILKEEETVQVETKLNKRLRKLKSRKSNRKNMVSNFNKERKDCLICDVSLDSADSIIEHELKVHEGGLICEICKSTFLDVSELLQHQSNIHSGRRYKCKVCATTHTTLTSLKGHTAAVHHETSFNKDHTKKPRVLVKLCRQKTHKNSEGEKMLEEPDSFKFSTLKFNLGKDGQSSFSCSLCDETFPNKKEIQIHILEKHDNCRFKCDSCEFKGKKQRDIARHRLAKHGVETDGYESYKCTYENCNVKMTCKIKLEQHLRVHDNLRPFICGVCDKTFQFKGSLKVHTETVHMKLKIHTCDKCGKAFSALSGLTYHKAVKHDIGEKEKHACEICGETTYYKATLQKHMEIKHTDRTKITCPHCKNLFISQLTLDRHIKSQHETDTRYSCPHCTKMFGTSYKQKVHIKTAHQNFRPFRCRLCKALFTEGNNLSVHIASVHDNVPLKVARKSSAAYRKHSAFERLVEGSLSSMEDDGIFMKPEKDTQECLDEK